MNTSARAKTFVTTEFSLLIKIRRTVYHWNGDNRLSSLLTAATDVCEVLCQLIADAGRRAWSAIELAKRAITFLCSADRLRKAGGLEGPTAPPREFFP